MVQAVRVQICSKKKEEKYSCPLIWGSARTTRLLILKDLNANIFWYKQIEDWVQRPTAVDSRRLSALLSCNLLHSPAPPDLSRCLACLIALSHPQGNGELSDCVFEEFTRGDFRSEEWTLIYLWPGAFVENRKVQVYNLEVWTRHKVFACNKTRWVLWGMPKVILGNLRNHELNQIRQGKLTESGSWNKLLIVLRGTPKVERSPFSW